MSENAEGLDAHGNDFKVEYREKKRRSKRALAKELALLAYDMYVTVRTKGRSEENSASSPGD